MKLKRLFCYKYFCFLFFLIFAGGVGFAGAGKIKPTDSAVTIVWDGSSWKNSDDTAVEWLNNSDEPKDNDVPDADGTDDVIALCTMNGRITLTLEADLELSTLFVFGSNVCTIDLNGYSLKINDTLFLY